MDKKKAIALVKKRTTLVNKLSDRLEASVKEGQEVLLKMVVEDFVDKLDTTDGKIADTLRNKRLIASLDTIFTDYGKDQGLAIASGIVSGVQQIFDFNVSYFSAFTPKTQLIPINDQVKTTLNGWLGLDEKGTLQENGYLKNVIQDPTARNLIKNFALGKVIGGAGVSETKAELKTLIAGDKNNLGVLEKSYRNFVYDTFSTVDRVASKIMADKLKLNYAIYEGQKRETSRQFCLEKKGKVFSREEISKFDPKEAKQPDYNPFTDLGGFGCIDHLNWIPDLLAFTMRPDLKKAS